MGELGDVVVGELLGRATSNAVARTAEDAATRAETRYRHGVRFTVELEREADGRWIAEILEMPGVLAYGSTREDALAAVKALTLRALADKIEHGEIAGELSNLSFLAA